MTEQEENCMHFNVEDDLKCLSLSEVQKVQKERSHPFAVACINVTGDLNISNIIRSAVVFGAKKVYIIGKRKFDRRGCVGSQNYIEIEKLDYDSETTKTSAILSKICDDGFIPMYVEQGGRNINEIEFWVGYKYSPCFVFGSESNGIPVPFLEQKTFHIATISIPQYGVIRSLNVASAASIVMNAFVSQITKVRIN